MSRAGGARQRTARSKGEDSAMDLRLRPIVATLGVTGLLFVAACGDDDDSTATTEASATTAVPATSAAPATTAAPATSGAPETTAAPATTEASGGPATTAPTELTDSYRGVTADSI